MFILEDKRRRRVAVLLEEPGVMRHLLAPSDARFPMWSLIDHASPAWFGSERMDEMLADLQCLQSPGEIAARQARWKRQVQEGILWLEADLAHPSATRGNTIGDSTMSSVLGWMREAVAKSELPTPEFPESLRAEVVAPYIEAIISLARRCRDIHGFLGHDPFVNEE